VSAGPRTWWGWHQLSDPWARRLVERADIRPGDLVLDIGAGRGAITHHLVRAGAHVVAIELHPRRVAELRRTFARDAVRVVCADATDLRLPHRPFKVVANPPFGITTALLRRLLHPRSRLQRAELVVPRHVAVRWANGRAPGAGRWGLSFDARVTARVPRNAFRPPPPGEVAVLSLVRRAR
jgi:23S rRNA (adenine-N6)-dimethyltransferase